jgi:WD40 repeat protein
MDDQLRIDGEHPWPGLSSFTEAAHGFFHGRDDETDELLRLVRRSSLSVLFGQSGLGKSSLLHAGLFPALRQEDCLPVSIRLDLDRSERPLADQVREALRAACAEHHAEFSAPDDAGTLWEFLHDRRAEIWSPRNRLLTPVLVFDQFEELFTLGRRNAAVARHVDAFLVELADVVEQRMPQAVVERIEADPDRLDALSVQRPVKLVLSFREDHLADIEGLRSLMPSVMRNRMRLTRMSIGQARAAIVESGRELVTAEVADRIIGFVARANAAPQRSATAGTADAGDIEPALLSVVCRELNNRRIAARQPRLTTELLDSGAPEQIIQEFYGRSFQGLVPEVQAWVEDHLLTSGGFRNSEAVEDAVQRPGVDRAAIDSLVARRLLRLDDRLGVLRVELTHDLLTRVARDSRDRRVQTRAAAQASAREAARRRRLGLAIGGSLALGALAVGLAAVFYVLLQNTRDEQLKLVRTQGQMLLAQARVSLERGIAGEPAAELAEALRRAPDHTAIVGRSVTLLSAQRTRPRPLLQRPAAEILPDAAKVRWSPGGALVLSNAQTAAAIALPDGKAKRLGFVGTDDVHEDFGGLHLSFGQGPAADPQRQERRIAAYDAAADMAVFHGARGRIVAYDLRRGRIVGPPALPAEESQSIAISADRRWFARPVQGALQVVGVETGELRSIAAAPSSRAVAVADGGTAVVIESKDGWQWALWAGSSYRVQPIVRANLAPLMSADGRALVVVRDNDLVRIEVGADGALVDRRLFRHPQPILAFDATSDLSLVATGSLDRSARVFEGRAGLPLGLPRLHQGAVTVVRFGSGLLATGARDGAVRLWRPGDERPVLEPALHAGAVVDLDLDSGGRRVAVLSADGTVSAWDLPPAVEATALADGITALALSPDGARLVAGREDGSVASWVVPDARATPVSRSWRVEERAARVTSLRFSADGRLLAAGRSDGSVALLTAEDGGTRGRFAAGSGAVRRLAWSPSGARLAAAAGPAVTLWDVSLAQPRGLPLTHAGRVESLVFSPDGSRLASAEAPAGQEASWSVRLWDTDTSVEILPARTLAAGERVGHLMWRAPAQQPLIVGGVWEDIRPWSGAESADGQVVFGGGADGMGVLVSARDGRRLGAPMRHDNAVLGADFSRDGRWVVSRAADGFIRVWDRPTGLPVADAVPANTDMPAMLLGSGRTLAFVDERGMLRLLTLDLDLGLPQPAWLPRLMEFAFGTRLDARGSYVPVADRLPGLRALEAELRALPSDAWRDWGVATLATMIAPSASPPTPGAGK